MKFLDKLNPASWFNEMLENLLSWVADIFTGVIEYLSKCLTTQKITLDWFDSFFPSEGSVTVAIFKVTRSIGLTLLVFLFSYYIFTFMRNPENCKVKPLEQITRSLASGIFIYLSPYLIKYIVDGLNAVYGKVISYIDSCTEVSESFASIAIEQFGVSLTASACFVAFNPAFAALIPIIISLVALLIMWPLIKQILKFAVIAMERCIVFIILCLFFPIIIAMKSHTDTENIFSAWVNLMIGQFVLLCTAYMFTLLGILGCIGLDDTNSLIVSYIFMLGFMRTAQRFDSYLRDMGFGIASTGTGLADSIEKGIHNIAGTLIHGSAATQVTGTGLKALGLSSGRYGTYKLGSAIESMSLSGLAKNGMPGTGVFDKSTMKSFAEGTAKMGVGNLGNSALARNAIERYLENPRENAGALEAFSTNAINKGLKDMLVEKGVITEKNNVTNASQKLNGDIDFELDDRSAKVSHTYSDGSNPIDLDGDRAYFSTASSPLEKNTFFTPSSVDEARSAAAAEGVNYDLFNDMSQDISLMYKNDVGEVEYHGKDDEIFATSYKGEIYLPDDNLDNIYQNIKAKQGEKNGKLKVDNSDAAMDYIRTFSEAQGKYKFVADKTDGIRMDPDGHLYFRVVPTDSNKKISQKIYISDSTNPIPGMKRILTKRGGHNSSGQKTSINYYIVPPAKTQP